MRSCHLPEHTGLPTFRSQGERTMVNIKKVSVALTPEMVALIRQVVESSE